MFGCVGHRHLPYHEMLVVGTEYAAIFFFVPNRNVCLFVGHDEHNFVAHMTSQFNAWVQESTKLDEPKNICEKFDKGKVEAWLRRKKVTLG